MNDLAGGGVEVYLEVERGTIVQATIFSDMLDPLSDGAIGAAFKRAHLHKTALEPCLAQLMQELPQYQLPLEEFQRWFIDQID